MTTFHYLDRFVRDAIVQFWNIRFRQIEKQKASNKSDAGCLILSKYTQPPSFIYPSALLTAQRFFSHFAGHLEAHINSK